ncbi:MAG TPA: hypothetical protein VE197_22960 [Mycobacterium sp.]|nr:hypothetical protein [Mycobacterium sp.]
MLPIKSSASDTHPRAVDEVVEELQRQLLGRVLPGGLAAFRNSAVGDPFFGHDETTGMAWAPLGNRLSGGAGRAGHTGSRVGGWAAVVERPGSRTAGGRPGKYSSDGGGMPIDISVRGQWRRGLHRGHGAA